MKKIIWPRSDMNIDRLFQQWNEKTIDWYIKRAYNKLLVETVPMFTLIEIETINRCNGKCSFCPCGAGRDPREYQYMSDELFQKVIDDLADMNYCASIGLYSNNEPLLDPKIIPRLKYAREKLQGAHHMMYTNGSLLSKDKFETISQFLDTLIIDNYNDNMELHPHLNWVDDHDIIEGRCNTEIWIRKENQILLNRGGVAPNQWMPSNGFTGTCIFPFFEMIVRPNGKLSSCCNDPLGEYTLGDLGTQTPLEAWYGDTYQKFRRNMIIHGKSFSDKCNRCDALDIGMSRDEYNRHFIEIVKANIEVGKRVMLHSNSSNTKNILELLHQHKITPDISHAWISSTDFDGSLFIIYAIDDRRDIFNMDPSCQLMGNSYVIYHNDKSIFPNPFM